MLQQDGKLSLDDKVAKYFPDLTRANEITVRQLLSHTSGYQDYWPQDYMLPLMVEPVTPEGIMDRWAKKPLDYEPGMKWQYSNTGYVIAGRIVEKVSGKPLFQFLQERIFTPLQMKSAHDFDREPLSAGNAGGFTSFALGPPRAAAVSGAGWLFGMGELAMTAEDLARWDISIINRSLLSESSYRALETETLLTSGVGTRYGLGVDVELESQRRKLAHGGEVVGFTADNVIYPDDRTAIVVLVNQDRVARHVPDFGQARRARLRAGAGHGRREDRAGTRHFRWTAAGPPRSQPVHGQRQLLFLRRGDRRFQGQPRAARCAELSSSRSGTGCAAA